MVIIVLIKFFHGGRISQLSSLCVLKSEKSIFKYNRSNSAIRKTIATCRLHVSFFSQGSVALLSVNVENIQGDGLVAFVDGHRAGRAGGGWRWLSGGRLANTKGIFKPIQNR